MRRFYLIAIVACTLICGPGCGQRAAEDPPAGEATRRDANSVNGPPAIGLPLAGRLVDLTHTFDADTLYWPTEAGFRLERTADGVTERGYYYAAGRFAAAEHGGTHVDAPIHFYRDRATVDAIPLKRLVGEGVVVDVSDKCAGEGDYQIGIADLRTWEEEHRRLLVDVILLLRTGFSRHWPDREKYLGTNRTGLEAVAELHFPGLAPGAARWLTEHRAVKAIGIDTASIDYGQSTHFESHVILFDYSIPALENVTNLEQLPSEGFTVVALPMKIGGGTGAPVRIVAILPE